MMFESKHNIRRLTKSYPRGNNSVKSPNNDLCKHYNVVKEEIHQFLDKLSKFDSFDYSKLRQYILAMVQELLEALQFYNWAKVLSIEHKFEFLVKFITNLNRYHDCAIGVDESKTNRERIQALPFPEVLKRKLITVNHLRNMACHELYELTHEDEIRIGMIYFQCLLFLLEEEFRPIINSIKNLGSINQEDYSDLLAEIKFCIYNYFVEDFTDNIKYNEEISIILEEVLK